MVPAERLGTVALAGVQKRHAKLWPKTVKAVQYVRERHWDDADWFMKADDDTWAFLDNLCLDLANSDEDKPHYMGLQEKSANRNATFLYGGTGV